MGQILVLKNLSIKALGGYPGELVNVSVEISNEKMEALTKALDDGKKQFLAGNLSTYEVIKQAMDTTFGEGNWSLVEFIYKGF